MILLSVVKNIIKKWADGRIEEDYYGFRSSRGNFVSTNDYAIQAFEKKRFLLPIKNLTIETRKNFIKLYIWSISLYECEKWTMKKYEKKMVAIDGNVDLEKNNKDK